MNAIQKLKSVDLEKLTNDKIKNLIINNLNVFDESDQLTDQETQTLDKLYEIAIENIQSKAPVKSNDQITKEAKLKETFDAQDFPHIKFFMENKNSLSVTTRKKHTMWEMQSRKYLKNGTDKILSSLVNKSKELYDLANNELNNNSDNQNYQKVLEEKERNAQMEKELERMRLEKEQMERRERNRKAFLGFDFDFNND